jgi:rubrerythrin
MSAHADAPKISSLQDLFAVAYQIEADAVDRYISLADQMETHNNPELAHIFRDLARAEGIHRDEIKRMAGDIEIVAHAAKVAKWAKGDSPEEADFGATDYRMTPWHALQLALAGEKRALAYFEYVVETTTDPKIREMAAEFVDEEAEHVSLCHQLLRRYPAPGDGASREDPDPPISQG